MNVSEFSNGFDTLVDSYRRFKDFDKKEELDSLEFDEYEKSAFLTMAQDEIVDELYAGKNIFGESFESTEQLRRYLFPLVKSITLQPAEASTGDVKIDSNSKFCSLPVDLRYIIYEEVTWNDTNTGCLNTKVANVYPVTHDEYNRIRKNPFRGANKNNVLRIDCGNGKVELISKYTFKDYVIRYVKNPKSILLEKFSGLTVNGETAGADARGSELPESVHNIILERAVRMAITSKGIRTNS